ncbi:MAG: hypothetical protein AAGM22_03720 [Acidobacteriota bacterium]
MSQTTARATDAQTDLGIQCQDVESPKENLKFGIELIQHGAGYGVAWTSSSIVAPDHAFLAIRLGDEEKARHKTESPGGRRSELLHEWGAGYRLGYLARSFAGVDTEFVVTPASSSSGGTETGSREFFCQIRLGMNQHERARVSWKSNLPFRPRESRLKVYRQDEEVYADWVGGANGHFETDVPWGVGLSAVLIGEDFQGQTQDLARTPRTRR